jgi:basic membrane protein A and related proteins
MRMTVKLLVSALVLVFALGLVACGDDDDDGGGGGGGGGEAAAAPEEEPLQVRVITAIPVDVGLWDPIHHRVYDAMAHERGWDLEVAEAVEYGRADEVLNRWGSEGVDLVFATDNGFEENLLAAAEAFPETDWAMMSDLSKTNDLENVVSYSINWCELGFAIGGAAGLVTESGTVGLVGAIPIRPQILMLEGQKLGADTAAAGTKVIAQDSGDFVDAVKAQETAFALQEKGADVLFTSHGGPIGQIARAAQQRDNYFVGFLDDSTDFAPDAVVTSVAFDFTFGYERVADAVENDQFEPGIFHSGLKEGSIDVLPFRLGFEDKEGELDDMLAQLEAREISFPAGGECEAFN